MPHQQRNNAEQGIFAGLLTLSEYQDEIEKKTGRRPTEATIRRWRALGKLTFVYPCGRVPMIDVNRLHSRGD